MKEKGRSTKTISQGKMKIKVRFKTTSIITHLTHGLDSMEPDVTTTNKQTLDTNGSKTIHIIAITETEN